MRTKCCVLLLLTLSLFAAATIAGEPSLEEGWNNVPTESRLRAYWWWLNGNVTKEAITRDLEEFKAQGFGGAVIIDAGGAEQRGNAKVLHGPTFASPEWRELYKHALREADRLGLVMSLTIQSGWNLGGPVVPKQDAVKTLVCSTTTVEGGQECREKLKLPQRRDNFYQDVAVVAFRTDELLEKRAGVARWQEKGMFKPLAFSTPDVGPMLEVELERPFPAGEKSDVVPRRDVLELSPTMNADGELVWQAPAGRWQILRFGYTIGEHAHVSTSSDGWQGYALDVLDHEALQRYWEKVVEPLIDDAGPLAGKTLKYLYTDSWEIEPFNWTARMRDEFQKRRGYDLLPYLPVLAGEVVESRDESNRFLFDFRKTLGELVVDEHWRPLKAWAGQHGLGWNSESGGPHCVPIDAQQCLGLMDMPMAEFWAWSWEHRIGDANRFFVKQPASAAHTNGRRFVAAEGFTTIGPHWQERIWDNLKPSFDKAACEGLNLLVWHAMVCSPDEAGLPGNQYFAGTHFNPATTWWKKSHAFLGYINRCQWMLQQGSFVADACYYYGDNIPNFTQRRATDPAKLGPGYDYDVISEDVLLSAKVLDGQIVLPSGMKYRLLVLHNRPCFSLAALSQVQNLVADGATVVGERPQQASGLARREANARQLATIVGELWGADHSVQGIRQVGQGRIAQGITAGDVLKQDGVGPDFAVIDPPQDLDVSYLHRQTPEADIYFVANFQPQPREITCVFRVTGKLPELWDPVTSEHAALLSFNEHDRVTSVPLALAPCGSQLIVFRNSSAGIAGQAVRNIPEITEVATIDGPWQVKFDPQGGGPTEAVEFTALKSWTENNTPGVKFYSGTATYRKKFSYRAEDFAGGSPWLDLGYVRELAEVKLNGKSLGVVWSPPFRVDLSAAIQPGENELEIEVVNFWPNRIIGDQSLPEKERLTKTNIRKLTNKTPLTPAGLLGPVNLVRIKR